MCLCQMWFIMYWTFFSKTVVIPQYSIQGKPSIRRYMFTFKSIYILITLHLFGVFVSCVCIVLQFIVKMSCISVSGIPDKTCPFHGTAEDYNFQFFMFLFFFTLHMSNCFIVSLSYVLTGYLDFLLFPIVFVAQGTNFLYMCKDIIFSSLSLSTLYGTIIITLFDDVF